LISKSVLLCDAFSEAGSEAQATFLNLPPSPKRVEKTKALVFYCNPFAIFLEDLVKMACLSCRYREQNNKN